MGSKKRLSWKEIFLLNYINENVDNLGKALEIKRKNMPLKLFRYRALNSQKNMDRLYNEIANAEIYMACPDAFNDPFDSRSVINEESLNKIIRDKDRIRGNLKNKLNDGELVEIFEHKNWVVKLLKLLSDKYGIKGLPDDDRIEEMDAIEVAIEVNKAVNKLTHSLCRVACFTESMDNLPMWNHYASEHEGVCLEYDIRKIENIYTINRFLPVFYVKELPNVVGAFLENNINGFTLCDYVFMHKLSDWKYEKEWRLMFNVGCWFPPLKQLADIDESVWEGHELKSFIRPSKIYLGYRIGEVCEKFIRTICKKYGIVVVKMKCTESGLEIEEETGE